MTKTERIVWCKHHQAPEPMEHECAVGIDIDALVEPGAFGRHYMLPCHDSTKDGCEKRSCDKAEWPTAEEIAHEDAEREKLVNESIERLLATMPLVERIKSEDPTQGVDPCPVCETGEIHWTRSTYNNHVHVRCTTDDCVAFME